METPTRYAHPPPFVNQRAPMIYGSDDYHAGMSRPHMAEPLHPIPPLHFETIGEQQAYRHLHIDPRDNDAYSVGARLNRAVSFAERLIYGHVEGEYVEGATPKRFRYAHDLSGR